MKQDGFSRHYREDTKFNSFIRRVCALPFVPSDMTTEGMTILRRLSEEMDSPELRDFTSNMIRYVERAWVSGPYSVQE